MTAADQFESMVGKRMSLMEFSLPWAYCNTDPCSFIPFPTNQMEAIRQRGSIPVFGWASYSQPLTMVEPDFTLAKVAGGAYDDYIRQWADDARDWGHPFFLQFDWEMNINGLWPYSESVNGNNAGDFVKTWRHVHDIFRQEGATNATWVWCAAGEYNGSLPLKPLYPGDDYVDWSCVDAYNWDYDFKPFSGVLGPTYDAVQAIAPSKPLLIGETASTEKNGNKAKWISDALTTQIPRHFPNVKGVVWFEKYEDRDWPIETSPGAKAAFTAGIASPFYAGATFGDVTSPIPPLTPVVPNGATQSGTGQPGSSSTSGPGRCVTRRSKVTGRRGARVRQAVGDPGPGDEAAHPHRVQPARRCPGDERAAPHHAQPQHERGPALRPPVGEALRRRSGTVKLALQRGDQGVLFAGRLSVKRTLAPGRYRISVTAVSSAGTSSQTMRGTFTLLK